MNRLILDGTQQSLNLTFGDTDIIGTGESETIVLDIGVNNIDNFPIQNSGDGIYFGRELSQYQITNSGGNIVRVKDSQGNNVYIAINSSGTIGFADGETTLSLDGITPQIDGNTLSTTPIDNSMISLTSLPTQIIESGSANPTFTKIIDGGDASSTYT